MQSNNRSRSCHGKSEMLFEDICCPSHNTSHVNNNKGKTEKDVTMSCSNIQVSPKPFSLTGTNLFIREDTVLNNLLFARLTNKEDKYS